MQQQEKQSLSQRYQKIRELLDQLAVPNQAPQLLVVSKGHSPDKLRHLYTLGQRHFAENYAQEFWEKKQALLDCPGIIWSFIGHLQSNKIKKIVEQADEIQTVGSQRYLELIAKAARECQRLPYPVWLECNAEGESNKHGCPLSELPQLIAHASTLPELRLMGLMCIPPQDYQDSEEQAVPALYQELRRLADTCGEARLSLGMSGDLRLAIAAGSNCLRIGTAILGARS